jgi:hypothetical protein
MNGDIPALPLYIFMAWRGTTLPLPLYLLNTVRDVELRVLCCQTGTQEEFGLFKHTFACI